MSIHWKKTLTASALVAASLLPAHAEEPATTVTDKPITLALTLAKGDRFRFRQTTDGSSENVMGEMTITSSTKTVQEYTLEVLTDADGGKSRVRMHYDRIHGHIDMPQMGEVAFDSSKSTEGASPMVAMVTKPMTALAGKDIEFTLSRDGKVSDVKGFAEAMREAMESLGMGAMSGQMDDSSIQSQLSELLPTFPAAPVVAGDEWKHEVERELGALNGVKESVSCRLAEVAEDTARIAATVKLTALAKASDDGATRSPGTSAGFGVQVELVEGNGTSDFRISRKDGLIQSATVTMTTRMAADSPMGGEMTMKHDTKSIVERLALAPTTPSTEK